MGKSASKPKKRKESASNISWSSKFGSLPLRSKSRINKANQISAKEDKNVKHIDISKWLKSLDLEKYESIFEKFNGVEDLLDFSEADLKDLGVKMSSDRAVIISNLTILRAKFHGTFRRQPSIRHSVAGDKDISKTTEEDKTSLDTIYEPVQSKSLNNLIMEATRLEEPSLNVVELRKALEWELALDSRDLRSHAWYHGAIPRQRAEEIVRVEGDFLVRDCTSQPGNYVLTCRTKTQPLHFVINKIVLQPDTVYEHVQFQFEEDAFDTVPDLITFYVGSGRPVTAASAARIQAPKNRTYPLSLYASMYPTPLPHSRLASPATTPSSALNSLRQQGGRPSSSPTPTAASAARLSAKKQRSHSLTPSEVNRISQEKCNSADGVIQSPLMTRSAGADLIKFSTHSLPRTPNSKLSLSTSANTLGRNNRITSDPTLSPCAERRNILSCDNPSSETPGGGGSSSTTPPPPPKPSRVPSIVRLGDAHRLSSYHASGSDSGNGSGDSALSSSGTAAEGATALHMPLPPSGVIIKNPRYMLSTSESSTTLKNFEVDYGELEERLMCMEQLEIDVKSRFDLENFQTLLLPVSENKPLDAQALRGVKMILQESGPRILANHLTRTDLDVVFRKLGKGVEGRLVDGIGLCALPHGRQFRTDLIERTECLKLLVAVTILTCTEESERTEMLNKWIEIAIDTKTALGNLFGFCGIMLGLCLPQVERLHSTWHMLRQKYTDAAFNFEAKLRPTLKNMNSCSNPQAPNTTIPHLLPFVLLMERELDDFVEPTSKPANHLTATCLGLWEWNTQDFGLGTLLSHLETARKYMDASSTYRRNAEIVLGEARMEELTTDMFRTEFQMKFLWGSRGAVVPPDERHDKFEQVLTAIADKYCDLGGDAGNGSAEV